MHLVLDQRINTHILLSHSRMTTLGRVWPGVGNSVAAVQTQSSWQLEAANLSLYPWPGQVVHLVGVLSHTSNLVAGLIPVRACMGSNQSMFLSLPLFLPVFLKLIHISLGEDYYSFISKVFFRTVKNPLCSYLFIPPHSLNPWQLLICLLSLWICLSQMSYSWNHSMKPLRVGLFHLVLCI